MPKSYTDPPAPTVAAGATPPIWEPWTATLAQAQSRLKSEIQAALRTFTRELADAGRLLDAARAVADEQSAQLLDAAWTAWHAYTEEAGGIHEAVMMPALKAHAAAIGAAHEKLRKDLGPAEHAFTQSFADAQWTANLAQKASGTL